MQRLWLLFAQTITIALALWFVTATLKPEWLVSTAPQIQSARLSNTGVVQGQEQGQGQEAPRTVALNATNSYRDAAKVAMPSVVNIFTTKEVRQSRQPWMQDPRFRRFFGEQDEEPEKQSSLGSGVIVNSEGFILTNNHVVEAADEIEVALADGRKASATVVGTDPESDLAVIRIKLPNLPSITLGQSEQSQVGDVVLAIGNPFGVGQTVTMGIISALGRNRLGINLFENFIQTDAAINPGNSGGALIDTKGNLIGINSAIFSKSGGSLGIGFAIPVSTAKNVMDSIIQNGQVIRGWIGIEPQDITPDLAENFGLPQKSGVIIAGVVRNGPADLAGARPGDILLSVEEKPATDTVATINLITKFPPGTKAKLRVMRRNEEINLNVVVGKRPKRREAVE
jgi:serine protease DegQ